MATNQLLPFASGENPNVLPFADWNSLPARLTGFQSGIASSQQFNYILAQGGSAGYVIGQLIADNTEQDATLDPESLYTNWKNAIAAFIPENVADGSIGGAKLTDNTVAFAKIASAAIATTQEAQEGESNAKLMTPARVKEAIEAQTPPALPTGSFIYYGGTDVPEGYLLCNGANVSRTTYAALFAVIGTKYGEGDGSSTFTLPNLDGRVLQGTNDTSEVGNYLEPQLPNITGKAAWPYMGMTYTAHRCHFDGALYDTSEVLNDNASFNSGADTNKPHVVGFDASKDDMTYSGSKLQVSALQVLACIKV